MTLVHLSRPPQAHSPDAAALQTALDQVVDPELDESLLQLGFVEGVELDRGSVTIRLRLPTFFCSPNFAYLMARDARDAALSVAGVEQVRVVLCDHAQSDEISDGVSAGLGFAEVFTDETDGNLDELRSLFRGKAFGMRQEQLARFLLESGLTAEELVSLHIADVLDTSNQSGLRLRVGGQVRLLRGGAPLARAYLERRSRVGLASHGSMRLITDVLGTAIAANDLSEYLQRGRRQRVSMTFNAQMCKGLLETRYDLGKTTTTKGDAQ
jgi:metal-sulfur cluster biosynthetic enzyme